MNKFFDMRNIQEFIEVLTIEESAMSKNATTDFQAVTISKGRLNDTLSSVLNDLFTNLI